MASSIPDSEIPYAAMTPAERLLWDAASIACGAALSVLNSDATDGLSSGAVDALALETATAAILPSIDQIAATTVGRLMLTQALTKQGLFVARELWGERTLGIPAFGVRQ